MRTGSAAEWLLLQDVLLLIAALCVIANNNNNNIFCGARAMEVFRARRSDGHGAKQWVASKKATLCLLLVPA
jgi:hypothetical protein